MDSVRGLCRAECRGVDIVRRAGRPDSRRGPWLPPHGFSPGVLLGHAAPAAPSIAVVWGLGCVQEHGSCQGRPWPLLRSDSAFPFLSLGSALRGDPLELGLLT